VFVSTATSCSDQTSQAPTPSIPSGQQAVLNVINQHWENIKNHNFSAAYQDLRPRVATGESNWVSDQQAAGSRASATSSPSHGRRR
jgi:hypothetical protein